MHGIIFIELRRFTDAARAGERVERDSQMEPERKAVGPGARHDRHVVASDAQYPFDRVGSLHRADPDIALVIPPEQRVEKPPSNGTARTAPSRVLYQLERDRDAIRHVDLDAPRRRS